MFKKVTISIGSFALALFFFPLSAFASDFTASNVHFDHTDGSYSFDYTGYTGGDIGGESNGIHQLDDTWYRYVEPASCSGGSSGSGHCSGTYDLSFGTFDCSTPLFIRIFGSNPSAVSNNFANPDPSCSPTPTPTIGGGGAAITIDPTDSANLNAAIGSIPTAAKGEIFDIFPVVMPYILLIITLGVAFYLVKLLMRKAH